MKIPFVFGIHNHQPVGNFDHVIAQACKDSYLPFLRAMAPHPKMKFCVHVSGCLWDWLVAHDRTFIDLIGPMVQSGQVELLSGAYQEPIYPVIPEGDLVGQIEALSGFLRKTFRVEPKGAWLTERVWEPHLPKILKRAGIAYTLVDDWHIKGAGIPSSELHGPFVTDHLGDTVTLLPIDERLRYLVPFQEPAETIAHLRKIGAGASPGTLPAGVLVDDGEKFGVGPQTHDWVFVRGWLDRFLAAMEAAPDIEWLTPSAYLARATPRGPVYVGTASYQEMTEWALPAAAQHAMHDTRESLKAAGALEAARPFLKGGTWRGFQSRYPEANWLHKKMLRVSGKVGAAEAKSPADPRAAAARTALMRGQCNCPYWHGVFGGLYLNYLRHAVWSELLTAERLADEILHGTGAWLEVTRADLDADGAEDIAVDSDRLSVLIKPSEGGAAASWELRHKSWNILDTLARREEAYHRKLSHAIRDGTTTSPDAPATSIHDLVRVKEPGLDRMLSYDPHPRRGALQDHLLAPGTGFAAFRAGTAERLADTLRLPYAVTVDRTGPAATITLTGRIARDGGDLVIVKSVALRAGSAAAEVRYTVRNDRPHPFNALLAIEWNLGMLAAEAPDRYVRFDRVKPADPRVGSAGDVVATLVEAVDEWRRVRVVFTLDAPRTVWRFPVETVSQSEGGFERTYQSTALHILLPLDLPAGGSAGLSFGFDVLDL